jgi:CubicO group peptidase (beta-lactamase class C family)
VRGTGDGGMYSTVADMAAFWHALYRGRIVSPAWVAEMTRPHSDAQDPDLRYGLGFWLRASRPTVFLEGYDAGVSFRSMHDEHRGLTYTVIGNTSGGSWPVLRALDAYLYP